MEDCSNEYEDCSNEYENCSNEYENCSNDYENCSNDYENCSNEYEDCSNEYDDYSNFKNSIIHLNDILCEIINDLEINVIYMGTKVNLLDYLPWLKKGYTTLESLEKILDVYRHLYNKKFPIIHSHYYDNIKSIEDKNRDDIYNECQLIESLYDNRLDYGVHKNNDIELEKFIFNIAHDWFDLLMLSKLGLYASIMYKYEWVVEELLNDIDPRDYNNEAYHLAVRIGNNEIINTIKNKIVELNWLDKEVLIKEFEKYDFLSADIIKHYQSMKY